MTSPEEADVRMPDREPTAQKLTVCLKLPVAFRPPFEEQMTEDYPHTGKCIAGR